MCISPMIKFLELSTILFKITFGICIMIIWWRHLLICKSHSQTVIHDLKCFTFCPLFEPWPFCCEPYILACGLNTVPIPTTRLVAPHFVVWGVAFGYFMNLVVDFGVCGMYHVIIRKLSYFALVHAIHSFSSWKKRGKKARKKKKNWKSSDEKVSTEKMKKVKKSPPKKSQKSCE